MWNNCSEPHTSTFNVKFCLYGIYVNTYITVNSIGHSYCLRLLNMCAYCALLHSVSLHQACPTVRPHLHGTDRERIVTETWDATYTLLYLAHTLPTMFYIHLVVCSLLLDQMDIGYPTTVNIRKMLLFDFVKWSFYGVSLFHTEQSFRTTVADSATITIPRGWTCLRLSRLQVSYRQGT